ncbi:hypothetical protein AAFC00_007058 [Neodothiora populina]|uniref:Vacuolar ATPase assembly integral membrane protein VMA21 n=1 Tax=Neodothiora populina TaxID=2781224 RepID=A0ABR3PC58_9PEZI
MATQRNVTKEQTSLNQQDELPSKLGKSNITPAVPKEVIIKLLLFTFAMIVCPIGSYFLTVNNLYSGNSTYAGATAAAVANVVLIGYVVVAFWEDQADRVEAEKEAKKSR